MSLSLTSPFLPMEAVSALEIPTGAEWEYEPKWDGFRCIAFRDGEAIELQSKAGKPLTRYFPEVVAALKELKCNQFVLDGELVITNKGKLSFDDLLQRIHPAASRINRLAAEYPATLIIFDLLADEDGVSLVDEPLEIRRKRLDIFHSKYIRGQSRFKLSPSTRDIAVARGWLSELRGQLDGVIAKRIDQPYQSGERAMLKIKNLRTADCIVGGFRYSVDGDGIGSLLLGLYHDGILDHVGFTSSLKPEVRNGLKAKLEKLIEPPGFTGRAPGGPSRWSTERSSEWQPLKPVLVVEVQFDHFSGGRFRHGTKFLHWRPDKDASQCTMDQVENVSAAPLHLLL